MTLYWIGFFAILSVMFVISFFVGQKIYGRQIALQNLKIAVSGIAFGMLLVAGFSALPNGIANIGNVLHVYSALSVCFVLWMLFRNKSFKGKILYTLHPTIPNKILFWLGVFQLVFSQFCWCCRFGSTSKQAQIQICSIHLGHELGLLC
jgi:hypothetical protein